MRLRRLLIALTSLVLLSSPAFARQPPAGQGAFVPADSVPLSDQLPAAGPKTSNEKYLSLILL